MTNNLFDPELAMLPILTATWDQSPVGAVIVYQNPILQTEIGHWTGRPLVELIGAIANSDGQPEIEQLVREGSLVLSGSLNDLEVKYHSRKGEQHIQVAISDNTEINRLRDKIQRDDLVNSFLSVSSHELKTPLTVVQGMISMLEDYTVDEEQKQLLEMAYENTVKLDNIMSRMLSLFHDESFKQETQKEKPCININQFILKLYRAELSPYLSILSFPEENLLLHAQSELSASPSALHKIFSEIMINLRRNTPPGGKVQITTKDEHDYVHLTIENSSEGIPPKSIDLLFDPLYRYQDSLTHSSGFEYGQGGIGMGLTIIKQLVINMGGNIWFENRLPYVVGQENRVALHIQLRKLIH